MTGSIPGSEHDIISEQEGHICGGYWRLMKLEEASQRSYGNVIIAREQCIHDDGPLLYPSLLRQTLVCAQP